MSRTHIFKTMTEYTTKFGPEASQELAEFSMVYIQRTKQQFETLLSDADRVAAAKYAHKVIGSVRLYGTPELEVLLDHVRDNNYAPEVAHDLQHELCAELASIDHALREWLAQFA